MQNLEAFVEKAQPSIVETQGFRPKDIIYIKSNDLGLASFDLGQRTRHAARRLLKIEQEEKEYNKSLAEAALSLGRLRELSHSYKYVFTTDGENHLERYIDSLVGYSKGVGIPLIDGALLQINDQAGCQTLMVRNTNTGEIAAIHTEEDSNEYGRSKDPRNGKHWVVMDVEGKHIEFYSYAGVCGWGGTSGVVEDSNGNIFFQGTDFIAPTIDGQVWANAVAFMTMDAGSLARVRQLQKKMKSLPLPIFKGGYVLNMVEVSGGNSQMATIEFGGNTIDFIEPIRVDGREVQMGSNVPRNKVLYPIDEYNQDKMADETIEEYEDRIAEKKVMDRRLRRLALIGKRVGRQFDGGPWGHELALETLKKVIEKGRGTWQNGWFTGLANDLVAQNIIFYVSPEGKAKLIVRNGYPKSKLNTTQ